MKSRHDWRFSLSVGEGEHGFDVGGAVEAVDVDGEHFGVAFEGVCHVGLVEKLHGEPFDGRSGVGEVPVVRFDEQVGKACGVVGFVVVSYLGRIDGRGCGRARYI